jgi:hypothetical protein
MQQEENNQQLVLIARSPPRTFGARRPNLLAVVKLAQAPPAILKEQRKDFFAGEIHESAET